jgi:hypothetical protein
MLHNITDNIIELIRASKKNKVAIDMKKYDELMQLALIDTNNIQRLLDSECIINDKYRSIVKQTIIDNGEYSQLLKFHNRKYIILSDDELKLYINKLLHSSGYMIAINEYYNSFNDKQKEFVKMLYMREPSHYLIGYFTNINLSYDFRITRINDAKDSWVSTFQNIRIKSKTDELAHYIFLRLSKHGRARLLDYANTEEKKFIFEETGQYEFTPDVLRKYSKFYQLCIQYCDVLPEEYKALLVKKLHAKSRWSSISFIMSKIKFNPEQTMTLESYKMLDDIRL